MALARDEQTQVAQSTKGGTAVSRGKTAPPVMQHMVVRLCAHLERDQHVARGAGGGFTAREEVGPRPTDSVLDHVRQEQGQNHAGQPAKQGDVRLVGAGAGHKGPEDEGAEGHCAGVDEEPGDAYALVQGVRVGDAQVGEVEHAVEGLGEELNLELCC